MKDLIRILNFLLSTSSFFLIWSIIIIYNMNIIDTQYLLDSSNISLVFLTLILSTILASSGLSLLLLQYNILLVLVAQELFIFLLLLEIMIILFIYILTNSFRIKIHALNRLVYYTLFSGIFLTLVILYNYIVYGTNHSDLLNSFSNSLILFTLLVKIPIFPFHIWLPYAHAEATTKISIILAALIIKLPFYGILKFNAIPTSSLISSWGSCLSTLTLLSLIYCTLLSIQSLLDIKRIIAYSSIIHMSIPFLLILENLPNTTSIQLILLNHGLTSALLFYLLGTYTHIFSKNILYYSGVGVKALFSSLLIIGLSSNISLPFPIYISFLSEYLNLKYIYYSFNHNILILILITLSISSIYFLIYFTRFLFGERTSTTQTISVVVSETPIIITFYLLFLPFILNTLESLWSY